MEKYVPLKTTLEIARIGMASKIAEKILRFIPSCLEPGITPLQINELCDRYMKKLGALPALKGYKGFPASVCTSVNNVAAHGIPTDVPLGQGDLITVDITVKLDDWYGDAAWTYCVGTPNPDQRRLMKAAWRATLAGIAAARPGNRLGDIGHAVTETANHYGCSVVASFVGHGIGLDLHEEPSIVYSSEPGTGQPIVPGLVFTVEPVLSLGCGRVKFLDDGWTAVTVDNALTAQYEHTIGVTKNCTKVLTFQSGDIKQSLHFPPFN